MVKSITAYKKRSYFKRKYGYYNHPTEGGFQQAVGLPLNMLNSWLFGIDDSRISNYATMHLDQDKKMVLPLAVRNKNINHTLISESGLYSLIPRSNKPEAKIFKK